MNGSLSVELDHKTERLLELIAEAGILGGTPEEVASYLIKRELDDMLRSGCIKIGGDA